VTTGRPAAAAPRILVVGDLMIDTIVKPEGPLVRGSDRRAAIVERPGGSAANQAAWLAHFGAAVDFVARVGAADRRRETARLARAGVVAHLVGDARRETGRLIALVEASGERSFLTDRGANLALCARDLSDALVDDAAMIHLSGYSFFAPGPREAVMELIARAAGRPVGVDPASAEFLREAGPEAFLAWTRGATMLFPNQEEAAVLAGTDDPETQGARLAAHYPLVVVKRGAAGCEAFAGAERWRVPAPPAEVKDSTGAGDAFVAAFLVARLAARPIERCLEEAAAAGAAATEFVGGQPESRRRHDQGLHSRKE
jgi:sugar/nucleoside kinase (ribokinase family)